MDLDDLDRSSVRHVTDTLATPSDRLKSTLRAPRCITISSSTPGYNDDDHNARHREGRADQSSISYCRTRAVPPPSRGDPMTTDNLPRSAIVKASDVLAEELRGLILGHALEQGAALPSEAELMKEYEFSRGTVREALRLLETDGLIVIKRGPKGGIRVRHPDIGQVSRSLALLFSSSETPLRDLFTFRKLVEPAIAAAAARSATSQQKLWLIEIAPQHYGVRSGFRDAVEFHGAIGRCSNNGVYEIVLTALHDALEWQVSEERLSHDDVEGTRRAHMTIAKAIAEGDSDAAARGMQRHLQKFEEVLSTEGRLDEPIIPRSRWRRRAMTARR